MTAKPAKDRMSELRRRRQILGLRRLEIWAHPDDHEAIKALAEKLRNRRNNANP